MPECRESAPAEVEGELDLTVERQSEATYVSYMDSEKFQRPLWRIVRRDDLDCIARGLQEAQHLLEAVGVAAHVRERCRLHQQRHPPGRRLRQWWHRNLVEGILV